MYKHLSEMIILIQKDTIQLLIFITNNFNHALRLSFFFLLMKVQIFFPKSPKSADIPPPLLPQTQTGMISTAYLLVSYKRLSLTFADKSKFLSGTNEKILTEMESRTALDIMRYPALPQLAQFLKRSCGAVTVLEE